MKIYFAPLQGYTDNIYRHEHHRLFGGIDAYYTPFLRCEKGSVRTKDIERLASPLNENIPLVPQIIFRNEDELTMLCDAIIGVGYNRIDLNLGCPFPMQTSKGSGCAYIADKDRLQTILHSIERYADVKFSIKMRLGMRNPQEWENIIELLNESCVSEITLHPRVARQLYNGELMIEEFDRFYKVCTKPLIYNGDILTIEDMRNVGERYPDIAGVMIGRGLLATPSLAQEYVDRHELPLSERLNQTLQLHEAVYDRYSNTLCGDKQILSKIKPFWDFSEPLIGHKEFKLIKKAQTLTKYDEAIAKLSTTN